MVCKKKLYSFRPHPEAPRQARAGKKRLKQAPADTLSIERGVRQALADKVAGNLVGVWLLVPDLLRTGGVGFAPRLDRQVVGARRAASGPAVDL
jgi:hypothetical protein